MGHQWQMGLGLVCVMAISTSVARSQDDAAADEIKAWQARRVTEFAAYQVVQLSSSGEMPLTLEKGSVLSWSNPIRKTAAGAVFLWTVEGRPQLIASTYPYEMGVEQELTSLSELPLKLSGDDGRTHRFTSGIEWKDVPDADPPHKQRALRLTQMRRIAERFRVQGNGANKFDARLLTQPIYRSPMEAKVDVAAFVFVQGTDPEAVLLVESTPGPAWRYALARMTSIPISADLDDNRVWQLPASWNVRLADNQPFHTVQLPGVK